MFYDDGFLDRKLSERISGNFLRELKIMSGMVDFCSNDYLGISTNKLLNPLFDGRESHGSRGARTLSGNYTMIEAAEELIAAFHEAEEALIFNSGYNANTGILASVPQRGDIILYDALCHASIRDGIRLSFAEAYAYRHNDMNDLEEKLRHHRLTGRNEIFIATESVFSMDGDLAPVEALIALSNNHKAHLIIDEAHAIGVIGNNGEGLVQSLGFGQDVFARIYTYGKAAGVHGAAVVGSKKLKSFLINFARSFIYTTALPEVSVKAIAASYRLFPRMMNERKILKELIQIFQSASLLQEKLISSSAIQGVIVPGNAEVKKLAAVLQENKLDIRPILYPSVPKGKERLRISMHSFNTREELDLLIYVLRSTLNAQR